MDVQFAIMTRHVTLGRGFVQSHYAWSVGLCKTSWQAPFGRIAGAGRPDSGCGRLGGVLVFAALLVLSKLLGDGTNHLDQL